MQNDVIMPNMEMMRLKTFLYISIALVKSYKVVNGKRGFRVEKIEKVVIFDGIRLFLEKY